MTPEQRKHLDVIKYQIKTQPILNKWTLEQTKEVHDYLENLYNSIDAEMANMPKHGPYDSSKMTEDEKKARQDETYKFNKLGEERSEVSHLLHEMFS